MPIYVDIKVNERFIHRLSIGRMEGGTRPDDMNIYSVVDSLNDDTPHYDEWMNGVRFGHRYGDGLDKCVERALQALERDKKA